MYRVFLFRFLGKGKWRLYCLLNAAIALRWDLISYLCKPGPIFAPLLLQMDKADNQMRWVSRILLGHERIFQQSSTICSFIDLWCRSKEPSRTEIQVCQLAIDSQIPPLSDVLDYSLYALDGRGSESKILSLEKCGEKNLCGSTGTAVISSSI